MSSWVAGKVSPVELDNKIVEATSESIPNGELELSIALEITDVIRSKKIPAKQCMRALKKRLTLVYTNPNLIKSTLNLIDLCVKNSGFHFLVEISSKEFMDYLVDFILLVHYNVKERNVKNNESKLAVGNLILRLIKEWSIIFGNQLQLNYVEKLYHELLNQGFEFPELNSVQQLNSSFVDSEVPPDWVDNDSCMICYTPFSLINRKHHCRACGGVYCQTHSSNNIPLVQLGIMEPVRVCDNCYTKQKVKQGKHKSSNEYGERSLRHEDDEDEQLRRAIELSLQDGSIPVVVPKPEPVQPQAQDEDEEMKAAIAASLKEYESEKAAKQQLQQQQQQPVVAASQESDLYNFSIPSQYGQQVPQQGQPVQPVQQTAVPPQHTQQDLSQAEEEQINLFITLMTTIKNDPKKQVNIMYDQDLNELHSKIIRLKPKLNKSLRNSIERYELFLEMNNKISTISRLYDQFLENKLNLATYGNYPQQQQQGVYPNEYRPYEQQPGYNQASPQNTGYNQAQGTGYNQVPAQGTGYKQPENGYNQVVPGQNTGYGQASPAAIPAQTSQGYTQQPAYPQVPTFQEPQQASYPSELKPEAGNFYPTFPQESYSNDSFTKPSEPKFDNEESEATPPKFTISQPTTEYSSRKTSQYPTSDYLPDSSNDYVTVSLPNYPPPEDLKNELPVQSFIRRASSSLPPNAIEDANVKFPSLDKVEHDYDESKLPKLPGNLPSFDEQEEETKRKYVAEPEPLIDL
ncbi:Vacuolar protein sorting-associated protein 27 [Spathaspora sp. JA1]|nr:Vacuolar protein sorting-associated protein 27 [Spathaspora sp. JA1]